MRSTVTILILALLAFTAAAQDKPDAPESVADQVLAAFRAEDQAALKALAEKDLPDPWLVADELCFRGEREAAEAFARAAPRKDTGMLPAYVASHRSAPADKAARAALGKVEEALRSRDGKRALAALGAVDATEGTVLSVRLRSTRAYVLGGMRRSEESAEAYIAVAAAAERLGWLRRQADSLDRAGKMRWRTSHLAAALALFRKRYEVEDLRGDRSGMGGALMNAGLVLRKLGEYSEAIEVSERAKQLKTEVGDAVAVARILGNLGNIHANLGDYPRALKLQIESLEGKRRLGDRNREFLTLHNIANLYATVGDYARALEANEEALGQARKLRNRREEARILASRASMYGEMGDSGRAIVLHERALDLWVVAKDRHGVAITLENLARTCDKLGDFETARGYAERSLAIREKIGDPRGASLSLSVLASISSNIGDLPKARSCAEQALELARKVGDPRALSAALINLAHIRLAQGDTAAALDLNHRARAIRAKHGLEVGVVEVNLGSIHLEKGEFEEAISSFERAVELAETCGRRRALVNALAGITRARQGLGEHRLAVQSARRAVEEAKPMLSGLGEEQGAVARSLHAHLFEAGARSALALDDMRDLAFFLESGRAGSLLESLGGRERIWSATIPDELRYMESRARAAERVALWHHRRALKAGKVAEVRARKKDFDQARERLLETIARIQREAKEAADLVYAEAAPVDRIRAWLGKGEVLVLFALFSEESLALVVDPGSARVVRLGPTNDIAATELTSLGDRGADPSELIADLRRRVLKPLGLPKEAKRLLVAPDGVLSYVPFALLVPEMEVVQIPSGTTYGLLTKERSRRGEGVLALGDPDYLTKLDPTLVARSRVGTRLTPLPDTRKEAKRIGDVVLLGKEATESGLVKILTTRPRWRAVHLACHGLLDPERAVLSSLALTADEENDGFLSALEVLRMRIPADLVVLSACETAKGRVYRAEGIVGLTRAFMLAGAPRVICSLWKVDDQATRALMVKFYDLWNPKTGKGLPAATALKKAREFVRDHPDHPEWKHPFYWAAWVLWGLPD